MNHISNVQQELAQILPQMMGEEYLFAGELSLHPKPIGARGFSAISSIGASFNQKASSPHWHGRLLRGLADIVVVAGYGINSLITTAEIVGALACALFISTVYFATGSCSEFLKNLVIKSSGYCVHSIAILAVQVIMLFNRVFSEHHSLNCIVSHSTHLLSAALVEWYFNEELANPVLNGGFEAEDSDVSALVRAIYTFIQKGPLLELLYALDRDFGEDATPEQFREQLRRQSIVNFLQHYPQHEAVIQDLGFDNIFQAAYRVRWRNMAADFVHYSYHPAARGELPEVHVINNNTKRDSAYQSVLVEHVKEAVKNIKNDATLRSYLSDTNSAEEGKEALEGFWPQIYVPIAHYAQLQELMAKDITCPIKFESSRLQQYNERHRELVAARTLLQALPQDMKPSLIRKLFQPSIAIPELCKELVSKIDALAGALHQGTLMSFSTIESITGYTSSQNLFQKACIEALR